MTHSSEDQTEGTTSAAANAPDSRPIESPVFVTTHWSVVLTAAGKDTPRATAALEQLCRSYWHPLYHYIRRQGYSPEDAQDVTQEFFSRFLEKESIAVANPERGRFRSFLLVSFKNFVSDAREKANAQKRGGGRVFPVDFTAEEARFRDETELPPDQAYERRWAISLLEQVYQQLEREARERGKAEEFAILRTALMGSRDAVPQAELAKQLGISEGAARVAAHRLRQRYREALREMIADTLASSDDVEEEYAHLLQVLSR